TFGNATVRSDVQEGRRGTSPMRTRAEDKRMMVIVDVIVTYLIKASASIGGAVHILKTKIDAHWILRVDTDRQIVATLATDERIQGLHLRPCPASVSRSIET